VTIIDLGRKLGLGSTEATSSSRNIIVKSPGEHVGLLVTQLSDVVSAQMDKVERAPANMGGIQGEFFSGVYKTEDKLIGILDINKVLRIEEQGH
jgi:purine-binding chemotaxis protein CheW